MDMNKYRALFVSEALEHLASMSTQALELEKDPSDKGAIAELFRQAHSIKGMAAAMSFGPVTLLAHALEDLMDSIQTGRTEVSSDIIDMLLDGIDILELMVKKVDEDEGELDSGEADGLIRKIRKLIPEMKPVEVVEFDSIPMAHQEKSSEGDEFDGEVLAVPSAPAGSSPTYSITVSIAKDADAPHARAFLALKKLKDFGEIVSSTPSEEEIKAGKGSNKLQVLLASSESTSAISGALEDMSGLDGFHIEKVAIQEPKASAAAGKKKASSSVQAGKKEQGFEISKTVKVKTKLLDYLINSVGELVTLKSAMRESAKGLGADDLLDKLDRLDYLTHDLHSHIISVRMMPLESVFQRLPRAVRDAASSSGKEVDFSMEGGNVELDRAILEKLTDPLVHILRNSVDHGIETENVRADMGKPAKGKVNLEARRDKDMVVISITDDGKGMDPEFIKESAVKKGIISLEEAEGMSDADVFLLTCTPSFSTKDDVTLISGRGVGMDIVKTVVQAVGGLLSIESEVNKGTTITISLPRTVAIMNVLLVGVKPEVYAIPISKIFRTVEIDRDEIQKSQAGNVFMFEGEPTPVRNLNDALGLKGTENGNHNGALPAIVIETGGGKQALIVDEFMGQQEAFIKPLGKPLERISGLAGITTLGDGRAVIVLDAVHLV